MHIPVRASLVLTAVICLGPMERPQSVFPFPTDAWADSVRDANGSLVAHPRRFGSGIDALADYVHSKGQPAATL